MSAKDVMASASGRAKVIKEVAKAYTYVLIWMSVSISVILFNKWLLAYSGFPFPIALTLWHMGFCSMVGIMAVRVLKVVKSHNMSAREYYVRVLPIGAPGAGPRRLLCCAAGCIGLRQDWGRSELVLPRSGKGQ
jgi:hypothetical protein